ncbi:SIS domain-containing protein [Anaerotruncus massiliensis (ex Liu et al. 2021)]|uniref:SIS domain-containing protein n=1 Tax=Anaerotruncus massiliensis (ex Liu et al. 2021) TaxID=2321404 RepID=UPI003AF45FCF
MFTIEQEIFSQDRALGRTARYLQEYAGGIRAALREDRPEKLVFLGCGSSYMLAAGAAHLFSVRGGTQAVALAGGEVMLAPGRYAGLFEGALVLLLSRSGETSEVLLALERMKQRARFRTLGITMKAGSSLRGRTDLLLELPWAFDESVCQTRTVTNLYAALLELFTVYSGDESLRESLGRAVEGQGAWISGHSGDCRRIASVGWDNVTVLADGELCGIAKEGALAFTEVCMLRGEYFRLLDYRHGPIVVADGKKLVIAAMGPWEESYQKQMVADIRKRGAAVAALGAQEENIWGADFYFPVRGIADYAAWGLPFIALCQMIAFYKAVERGHNPDMPDGLDPYISLD